ncbi:MAG TPA: hypothetical protein VNI52_13870 [Sphingobacteriaceae bacterium]|nr:hypothetical protein [Sphingobacteriaceae bacterium]
MKALLYRRFVIVCLIALFPFAVKANNRPRLSNAVFATDSIPPNKQPAAKPSDKPEIKEVPKSKRQLKPSRVDEKIRIKPPIKIKPDIIKRPIGQIKGILKKI